MIFKKTQCCMVIQDQIRNAIIDKNTPKHKQYNFTNASDGCNDSKKRRIVVSGKIASICGGREHFYYVRDARQAIRLLCLNYPKLEKYLMSAHMMGFRFAIFNGNRNVSLEEIEMTKGSSDIRILPIITGSKRSGLFQTILGAVLVIAGYALSGFTGGASLSLVGPGVAIMAGGVVQMLSPQVGGLASRQSPDNKPSYAFGGPVNSTAQGNPVGVLYGKRRIGGAVISAGIYAEDQM